MTTANHSARSVKPRELPGPEPTAPQLGPLSVIHRHQDGFISFHRKTSAGQFENLFGVRSEHLPGMFPEFEGQLETDSFFSLNAFFHRREDRGFVPVTQTRRPDRLRYLCASYVDIDFYKQGLEVGTAFAAIISRQEKGLLPAISIIVRSGRGLWLLWLLSDDKEPERPPRAWPDKLRTYLEINRAANESLADLGADPAAVDAMRIMRMPGSMNSKVPPKNFPRVKFWVQLDSAGRHQTYSLAELAGHFNIEARDLDQPTARAFADVRQPTGARLRGHSVLNASRLRDFELLRTMRGRFREGCRHYAILTYAWLLSRSGASKESARSAVTRLALECDPPTHQAEVNTAIKSARSRQFRRLRDYTIADWLIVTPEEAEVLERFPAAARFAAQPGPVELTMTKRDRQAAIQRVIVELKRVPTLREMADVFTGRGYPIGHVTIRTDYRELGIDSGRTVDARVTRKQLQSTFPALLSNV